MIRQHRSRRDYLYAGVQTLAGVWRMLRPSEKYTLPLHIAQYFSSWKNQLAHA